MTGLPDADGDAGVVVVAEAVVPLVVISGFGVWMDGATPVDVLIGCVTVELVLGDAVAVTTCLTVMVVPEGMT